MSAIQTAYQLIKELQWRGAPPNGHAHDNHGHCPECFNCEPHILHGLFNNLHPDYCGDEIQDHDNDCKIFVFLRDNRVL